MECAYGIKQCESFKRKRNAGIAHHFPKFTRAFHCPRTIDNFYVWRAYVVLGTVCTQCLCDAGYVLSLGFFLPCLDLEVFVQHRKKGNYNHTNTVCHSSFKISTCNFLYPSRSQNKRSYRGFCNGVTTSYTVTK